jgi:hypothetical protein
VSLDTVCQDSEAHAKQTRRSIGRNAEFYVIRILPTAEQPAEFHTGKELTVGKRENFWSFYFMMTSRN